MIAAVLPPAPASAQQDEMQQLKDRFAQRYPKLVELKRGGKAGETWQGYIETVKPEYNGDRVDENTTVAQFVAAENADRRRLYQLVAEMQQTTAQKVAERNALRNFSKAANGEYLKGKDGKWVQKGAQQ
jgi:hypothetical protein